MADENDFTPGVDKAEDAVYSAPTALPQDSVFSQVQRMSMNMPDAMGTLGVPEPNPEPEKDLEPESEIVYPQQLSDVDPDENPVAAPAPVEKPSAEVVEVVAKDDTKTPVNESVPYEQYQALLDQINHFTQGQGAPQNAAAPSLNPTQNTNPAPASAAYTAPAATAPAPSAPVDYVTPENHLSILEDPKALNGMLNQMRADMKAEFMREALLQTIPVAVAQVNHQTTMNALVDDFGRSNPDLSHLPMQIIGNFANEIAAQNPTFGPKEVFNALGEFTRDKLKIKKVETPAAPPKIGAFAPTPTAVSPVTNASRPATPSAREQLGKMAVMLNQFQ